MSGRISQLLRMVSPRTCVRARSTLTWSSLDDFTEELLSIHEAEIRKLREERRLKAPLLASIKKYFKICEEEKELAAAASDQTRLLGRGRDPGRLLREEKMRKRVQKEKPRVSFNLSNIPILLC
jgi:Ase1/PRC1/MAP65 family protein